MLKSYRVGWGGVVAYVILVSAQVPLVLTLGLWDFGLWDFGLWDFGLGLDNFSYSLIMRSVAG